MERATVGARSNLDHRDVPRVRLPMALADLHGALDVGALFEAQVLDGDYASAGWTEAALRDVLVGAGFEVASTEVEGDVIRSRGTRARSLADTVADGMRLLVCGLNPSVYSAERGVGYARPGNRFWPAAVAAGLVTRPLDAGHALRHHGVGLTDLCKRATVASAELSPEEYRDGAARVERLVRWLQPRAVCFVGLEGWRVAVDRKAKAGEQPDGFGGRPAYVLPSTSGLNAHSRLDDLVTHLRHAAELADRT